jgi:chemotaxis protein MotB
METSHAREPIEDDSTADWIVTYADMVTLLLVFFILLFSISSLNLEKFKHAIQSIQVSLGEKNPSIGLLELIEAPAVQEEKISIEDITGLRSREKEMIAEINNLIQEKKLGEHIILSTSQGKIMLQIRGAVLFESGSATMNPQAMPILDDIINIIEDYLEYSVNIKGHTDNIPIATKEFPSNWELSSIRATSVLKYLIAGGVNPSRLTATGYADLLPIVPNISADNRSKNRRVEFVLEKKTAAF